MKKLILTLFVLLYALPVSAEINISNAYIPKMPPSSATLAAYFTITNEGDQTRTIIGIEAAGFEIAHLHKATTSDGVSAMKTLHRLMIKPGETVVAEPGGLHAMLMKPEKAALAEGQVVLKLHFDDGVSVDVIATVGDSE